jgi:hypothetical protein
MGVGRKRQWRELIPARFALKAQTDLSFRGGEVATSTDLR